MKIYQESSKCREILSLTKFKKSSAIKFIKLQILIKEEEKTMNLMKFQDFLKQDGPRKNMSQPKELKKKLLKNNAMIF